MSDHNGVIEGVRSAKSGSIVKRLGVGALLMALGACSVTESTQAPPRADGVLQETTGVAVTAVNNTRRTVIVEATELPGGSVRPGSVPLGTGDDGFFGFAVDNATVKSIALSVREQDRGSGYECPLVAIPRVGGKRLSIAVELVDVNGESICRVKVVVGS